MPTPDRWRGFRGGAAGPCDPDDRVASPRPAPQGRTFDDPGFRAEDARLNAALNRQDREPGRIRQPDYGHDQNYRPGYHEGGSRFGFFGLGRGGDAASARAPSGVRQGRASWRAGDDDLPSDIDQDLDPDYLHWRTQQLQRHDRDYADWRRQQREQYDDEYRRFRAERRDDFHQRFQDWRAQRDAAANSAAPDDKI